MKPLTIENITKLTNFEAILHEIGQIWSKFCHLLRKNGGIRSTWSKFAENIPLATEPQPKLDPCPRKLGSKRDPCGQHTPSKVHITSAPPPPPPPPPNRDDNVGIMFNTLRLRQNGRRFADDTFKPIFLNENIRISTKNSLNFVPKGFINNIPALVLIMAWRRPGDKPLSELMLVRSLTHICVTRPQWVKWDSFISFC